MFTGEKLTKEEAKGLMNELCDPEDAEGFTPFMRKFSNIISNNHEWISRHFFEYLNILHKNLGGILIYQILIYSFLGKDVQERRCLNS